MVITNQSNQVFCRCTAAIALLFLMTVSTSHASMHFKLEPACAGTFPALPSCETAFNANSNQTKMHWAITHPSTDVLTTSKAKTQKGRVHLNFASAGPVSFSFAAPKGKEIVLHDPVGFFAITLFAMNKHHCTDQKMQREIIYQDKMNATFRGSDLGYGTINFAPDTSSWDRTDVELSSCYISAVLAFDMGANTTSVRLEEIMIEMDLATGISSSSHVYSYHLSEWLNIIETTSSVSIEDAP